jgi:thiol-disulfide isomerase/thioredoxin
MAEEEKSKSYTTPVLIILVAAAFFLLGNYWAQSKKTGEKSVEEIVQASPTPEEVLGEVTWRTTGLGNFVTLEEDVCLEGGKPIVYYFGRSSCPHCSWEHPIFEKVVKKFTNLISVHDRMDQEGDEDIFRKYSQINQGGIPFMILGCQYAQVGSGEGIGEEEEETVLTALICQLTGGEPESVCTEVQD